MQKSVAYYNIGTRCLIRLITSIYSLRKVWHGDIIVFLEGATPEWVFHAFHAMKVRCQKIMARTYKFDGIKTALIRKTDLPKLVDSDTGVFLDADTIVVDKIDPLFELPKEASFGVTAFSDWHEGGHMIAGRITAWDKISGGYKPHDKRPAVNTGVFCWRKGSKFVDAWHEMTLLGAKHPETGQSSTIMVDEIACQVLLDRPDVAVFDSKYCESVKFGVAAKPAIIHFHGGKHLTKDAKHSGVWEKMYEECCLAMNDVVLAGDAMRDAQGDKALAEFLGSESQNDITLVVAVDEKYLPCLQRAWPIWMKRKDLSAMQVAVILSGIETSDNRLDFLRNDRVRFISWNKDEIYGDHRTSMFASFLYAVAQHVQTTFWLKMDVDTVPGKNVPDPMFSGDDFKYDLVANPWGFTKVKGDKNTKTHWINRLDQWWFEELGKSGIGEKFPKIEGDKFRHQRHISKICLERTECTRQLAKLLDPKMPIPSQDTLVFFWHHRTGGKVKYKKIDYGKV